MSQKVDVSIAFFGKPYQTIVAIKSLMQYSGQHVDKIYISHEIIQPHGDFIGIFKVADYFSNSDISIIVHRPKYFPPLNVMDKERAKTDAQFRQSLMFQYALETTDKKYLYIMHNDLLYHGDRIGELLSKIIDDDNIAGVGSIGQCWSCPAGPNWGNRCDSDRFEKFVPTQAEAISLTKSYATPRRELQLKILNEGRVHPLPECRLNEYGALINVPIYRKETIPNGATGCFGGNWGGVDIGTVWSYEMYNKGYRFINVQLEKHATHAPFDNTGSGTAAYSKSETYFMAEKNAEKYITENYGLFDVSYQVQLNYIWDTIKRKIWLGLIHTYGFLKKLIRK